jgi:predicted Zn-dependent protease
MNEKSKSWIGLGAAAVLVLAACATTTQDGAVGVQRSQFLGAVSSQDMEKGSVEAYGKVMQEAQAKGALNRDAAMLQRVRGIAQRLIPHTAVFRKDAPGWQWEVNVLTSKEINAWCMPGGKIAFYTGIIETLQMNDDEIAAVMGHEIAHALREHSRERASRQAATGAVVGIGAAILGLGQVGSSLGNMVANAMFNLPNSREQETESDRIGVELAARGGYDPRGSVSTWQKMAKLTQGGGGPNFLSTHPSHESRISDLTVYSAKVMPLYEQARKRSALEAVPMAQVESIVPDRKQRTLGGLAIAQLRGE